MKISRKRRKQGIELVFRKREYQKIGFLSHSVAKHIGVEAGDIMIDAHTVTHLLYRHKMQLDQLGLTPIMFAKTIVSQFNQIYEGKDSKLLLVCMGEGEPHHNTAVIGLFLNKGPKEKSFWQVVTACPRSPEFFNNKILLYEKKR